jgi:hypothetical protein
LPADHGSPCTARPPHLERFVPEVAIMDDERGRQDPERDSTGDAVGPAQGGGPPDALPWTLVVEDEAWSADLEHGTQLPCAGDRIEYITEHGERRLYVVDAVVHTLQRSASERPRVGDAERGLNALVDPGDGGDPPRLLRAGLPRVIVHRADRQVRPPEGPAGTG